MRLISEYEDFLRSYNSGHLKLDFPRFKSWAKNRGWSLGMFRATDDFLKLCGDSEENFKAAFQAGADFWKV